jgi:hypothetical protein
LRGSGLLLLSLTFTTGFAPVAASSEVALNDVQARGAVDQSVVEKIVGRHLDYLKPCYERELRTRPDLQTYVQVRFTVSASGQVISWAGQSLTFTNSALDECLASRVRAFEFPARAGSGGTSVSAVFALRNH